MDILFTYPEKTHLLYYFSAALTLDHSHELMKISSLDQLRMYDYSKTGINMLDLMSKAVSYNDYYDVKLIKSLNLSTLNDPAMPSFGFQSTFPLPIGYYPIFKTFPREYDPITKLDTNLSEKLKEKQI